MQASKAQDFDGSFNGLFYPPMLFLVGLINPCNPLDDPSLSRKKVAVSCNLSKGSSRICFRSAGLIPYLKGEKQVPIETLGRKLTVRTVQRMASMTGFVTGLWCCPPKPSKAQTLGLRLQTAEPNSLCQKPKHELQCSEFRTFFIDASPVLLQAAPQGSPSGASRSPFLSTRHATDSLLASSILLDCAKEPFVPIYISLAATGSRRALAATSGTCHVAVADRQDLWPPSGISVR